MSRILVSTYCSLLKLLPLQLVDKSDTSWLFGYTAPMSETSHTILPSIGLWCIVPLAVNWRHPNVHTSLLLQTCGLSTETIHPVHNGPQASFLQTLRECAWVQTSPDFTDLII